MCTSGNKEEELSHIAQRALIGLTEQSLKDVELILSTVKGLRAKTPANKVEVLRYTELLESHALRLKELYRGKLEFLNSLK